MIFIVLYLLNIFRVWSENFSQLNYIYVKNLQVHLQCFKMLVLEKIVHRSQNRQVVLPG